MEKSPGVEHNTKELYFFFFLHQGGRCKGLLLRLTSHTHTLVSRQSVLSLAEEIPSGWSPSPNQLATTTSKRIQQESPCFLSTNGKKNLFAILFFFCRSSGGGTRGKPVSAKPTVPPGLGQTLPFSCDLSRSLVGLTGCRQCLFAHREVREKDAAEGDPRLLW